MWGAEGSDQTKLSSLFDKITFSQVHETEFETRYSTQQKEPDPGESDYRDFTRARFGLLSKFYLGLPQGWRAHASFQGYYDTIYEIEGRDEYTDQTLDEYESELEVRNLYLQGSLTDTLDVRLGRQITSWGYADFLRGIDILNPLDNRDPGLIDLEDRRLPVAMTRIDYYPGDWQIQLSFLHEFEETRTTPFGSEFYPFPVDLPNPSVPYYQLDRTGVGLQVNKTLENGDVSFYFADLYDNIARFRGTFPNLSLEHNRIQKWGAAYQHLHGNWLFKSETGWTEGLKFGGVNDEKSLWEGLVGLEYNGWDRVSIIFELLYQRLIDYDEVLHDFPHFQEEEIWQTTLFLRYEFHDDTWELNTLFFSSDALGHFQRMTLDKEINDHLTLQFGYINFFSGDNIVAEDIGRNDKLFFKVKYTF